jgi:membrane associated rhomboid family serine protease
MATARATRTPTGSTGGAGDDRTAGLKALGALLALMWFVEVVDLVLPADLDRQGIEPRDVDGLTGVVLAPFLHADFGHLIGNTLPFAVLGAVIALAGVVRLLAVTAITAAVSGIGVWLVAPANTITVGASGVVFGYATYLIARGVFSRSLWQLAIGVAVIAVFGSMLLFGLVPQPGVSWQGHLFGGVGGVLAARWLTPRRGV